ncbi:MAG: F0F1 ATP synthase subunit B [Desulfuromonadales bacterium]|jgi:F-type H+-transporting ATPase subunit b
MKHNISIYRALLLCLFILAPVAAFAAGGGGHADSGAVLKDFIYRCFNFALMAGLLAYFVTKPIRKGLKGRTEEIEKTLADAESAKAAAEAKHKEYSDKLAKATEEIAGITEAIRREGELERDKIIAAAKDMADKIEREADNKAAGVVAKARIELREEASRLAVELAEDMLKKQVSADDQKRLVEEYMQKMGELH